MHAPELEIDDFETSTPRARAGRALGLIAVSVIAVLAAGTIYLQPSLGVPASGSEAAPVLHADYRVTAVDFVSPKVGWLVVDFASGDFGIVHTIDGGARWAVQLAAPGDGHQVFVKFFDSLVGVMGVVGGPAVLSRTSDGGTTWVRRPAFVHNAAVLSWSFVDSLHGWALARTGAGELTRPRLYRTDDGGLSWADLGDPVRAPDQAFQVQFSYLTTGWLSTVGSGPYAYRTDDFGVTWTRVDLPAGKGSGEYFVAVRPTTGLGVVASVVYLPPVKGRSGIGGIVRGYPPLTVRAFDGGRPHTYIFSTLLDQFVTGPFAEEPAPNQLQLGTVDGGATWSAVAPPSGTGAIGYSDATHWLWVGGGRLAGSADGGATWTEPRAIGAIDPVPGSLQVLDGGHAWFAGSSMTQSRLAGTDDGGAHWKVISLPPLEDLPAGSGLYAFT